MSNVSAVNPSASTPTLRDYAEVTAILLLYGALLAFLVRADEPSPPPDALLAPLYAMLSLVGLVWLLMVVTRNYAVLRGLCSIAYYRDYTSSPPAEWVDRTGRTFNNLMQVPTLFYVLCLLMLQTGRVDAGQLTLAWAYVATRAVHAFVYITWNAVPYRFATWNASTIALAVMWFRFV